MMATAQATVRRQSGGEEDVSWEIDDDEPTAPAAATAAAVVTGTAPPAAAAAATVVAARRRSPTGGDEDIDPEWQRCTPQELVRRTMLYLSTCRAPTLIDEASEAAMFPTLVSRAHEVSVSELLDIIEVRWPEDTRERHFEAFSEAVRTRILGEVAAFEAAHQAKQGAARGWLSEDADPAFADPAAGVTAPAELNMSALLIARCIVVVGLRGRRRRDLDLFRALGHALSLVVNDIRDPHTLCYVLIAFQSSRIRPPDAFLGMVGRRLPVLNKTFPMAPLPAYRALCFYDRSGYEMMNPYRFLADRIMAGIKSELQREGGGDGFIEPRVVTPMGGRPRSREGADEESDDLDDADFAILSSLRGDTEPGPVFETSRPPAPAPTPQPSPAAVPTDAAPVAAGSSEQQESREGEQKRGEEAILDAAVPAYASAGTVPPNPQDIAAAFERETPPDSTLAKIAEKRQARARFLRVVQLKPPQLTKMLKILGSRQAPRQQYLRPIATELLVPSVEHFNPPSFSRLISSMKAFQSEEAGLIEKIISVMCERGPTQVPLSDVLDMLHLLSRPTTPLANADKFFVFCREVFADGTRLRPRDMLGIVGDLLLIRKLKFDEEHGGDTEAYRSLVAVVDAFAERMASFLDLGLVEPPYADGLLDMCAQLRPDATEPTPAVGRLLDAKQAALRDGDDAYHELVAVSVRECFLRIQSMNATMTHRGYQPLSAKVMQEFKALLDYMRADTVLEAVHLYEQAYPGALSVPVKRVVGMFIVDKLALEVKVLTGKVQAPPPPPEPEVVPLSPELTDKGFAGNNRVYKPYDVTSPTYSPLLFKPTTLAKFANIVIATPLKRVSGSQATWEFLGLKARQFQSEELTGVVQERLEHIAAKQRALELAEMRGKAPEDAPESFGMQMEV